MHIGEHKMEFSFQSFNIIQHYINIILFPIFLFFLLRIILILVSSYFF